MHYVAHADLAFESVEHIMRDVNYGWLIRYVHANGASMFFLAVYIHIFRSLYYGYFYLCYILLIQRKLYSIKPTDLKAFYKKNPIYHIIISIELSLKTLPTHNYTFVCIKPVVNQSLTRKVVAFAT